MPSGRFMLTQTERLLRLNAGKKPMARPVRRRVLSPAGAGSILITSAPRSASTMPALGPMTMWLNSITRTPASGPGCSAAAFGTGLDMWLSPSVCFCAVAADGYQGLLDYAAAAAADR